MTNRENLNQINKPFARYDNNTLTDEVWGVVEALGLFELMLVEMKP